HSRRCRAALSPRLPRSRWPPRSVSPSPPPSPYFCSLGSRDRTPARRLPTMRLSSSWRSPPPASATRHNDMVPMDQDPRIERSRRVILEAALTELGEIGYGALTIESVAARAGVGKSTIYRHWPGKLALVEDAFRTLKASASIPETGTIRERMIAFLEQIAQLAVESTYSACMPALIEAAERDPQVRAFHCDFTAQGRKVLVDALQGAVDAGELPESADPDLLADALVAPIIMRRLMYYEPFDPKLVPALVDQILPSRTKRAVARRAASADGSD